MLSLVKHELFYKSWGQVKTNLISKMGLDVRKPVFDGLRKTKVQTSLRIRAVWSALLLFGYSKLLYLDLLWLFFSG